MNDEGRQMTRHRGFTILEILIALALITLIVVTTMPSIRSLTRVELSSTAGQLFGLVRDTYSRAALSGQTFRIVFDLDQNTYWVESSKDDVRVFETDEAAKKAEKDEENASRFADPEEREKKKYLRKPEFSPVEDELGAKQKLPSDVRLFGVWTQGMAERARTGSISLYFFPTGYTQRAQISLTDDLQGKHVLVLVVEPLTGEVVVEHEELPIK